MTNSEKLTEAKLMAVENILLRESRSLEDNEHATLGDTNSLAKEILSAIRNEEIKAELADTIADAETKEDVPF